MPPAPPLDEQIRLIRATGHVHATWYRDRHPEVDLLGMHPAEHYLRLGADLGRNPGGNFDTQYYLETYPDAAASGLNPLLHFAMTGRQKGYRTSPPSGHQSGPVLAIRRKLLGLGFTDRPLAELQDLAATATAPVDRAWAGRELALWAMRETSGEGFCRALDHVARAREAGGDPGFAATLATIEILCHHHLGAPQAGRDAYDRAALAGAATANLMLARATLETTPQARLAWINVVLARHGIAPLALCPEGGGTPAFPATAYDRLTAAGTLPAVTDGPKVTVLIAAHEAAETLPTALRALQEQTWRNLEILVIDDASPDPATLRVAEGFAARDPRIRAIGMPVNGGAYVARNRGLDLATGEFVTLHDADDWSHPAKIETQVRALMDMPALMGCKSEQARIGSDLRFTRWTGHGIFIIPNTSSFMFRRAPMRERLGYWDTVRFSADNELVRRMRRTFGRGSVRFLATGPLSFQRDSDSSIVADDVLGINGFLFGVRKEYFDAQRHHHESGAPLKYDGARRPFPAPEIMRPDREKDRARHLPVIVGTDWRHPGRAVEACLGELRARAGTGQATGAFQLSRYDPDGEEEDPRLHMSGPARSALWRLGTEILSYGDTVSCDLLLLRDPAVLWHPQRYLPRIKAEMIRVILDQPPTEDSGAGAGPGGRLRYDIAACAENIRHWFGQEAVWHPTAPLVRAALTTRHADQLHHIDLSPQDWAGPEAG
ncbi:MAG: glycosyltransferase family 2 protein [Pseudorhodobacter sp.]